MISLIDESAKSERSLITSRLPVYEALTLCNERSVAVLRQCQSTTSPRSCPRCSTVEGAASSTQSLVVTETLTVNGQTTTLTLSGPTSTYTQAISVISAASTTCGAVTVTDEYPDQVGLAIADIPFPEVPAAPLSYVTAYIEHFSTEAVKKLVEKPTSSTNRMTPKRLRKLQADQFATARCRRDTERTYISLRRRPTA